MTESQNNLPLISVVILNYKRLTALAQSLESVLKQDYVHREIIVVDNHSEEDVAGVVYGLSRDVQLVELSENLGPGGGRNAGIRKARGEIIITLDNDVYFDSPRELSLVAEKFGERPEVHVLAFQLCDAQTGELRLREWCHPRNWKDFGQTEFETNYFVEGACAVRREVFEKAGLYYEPLFIYNEGWDLGIRFLDHGFRILYTPNIRVRHLMSPETRSTGKNYHFFTRNYIWIAYKDYPLAAGVKFLTPKLAMMLYFALRSGHLRQFIKGIWDGVKGLPRIRQQRTPLRRETLRYLARLEKNRPGLLFRLERHRASPQL